jgi:hypothetical protein
LDLNQPLTGWTDESPGVMWGNYGNREEGIASRNIWLVVEFIPQTGFSESIIKETLQG